MVNKVNGKQNRLISTIYIYIFFFGNYPLTTVHFWHWSVHDQGNTLEKTFCWQVYFIISQRNPVLTINKRSTTGFLFWTRTCGSAIC